MKRYYKIKDAVINDRFGGPVERMIKVHITYQLGGMNYFQGQQDARGYYLHVAPVERGETFESMTLDLSDKGGFKVFLLEVKRKSKASAAKAERLALETLDKYLEIICDRTGIELTGSYEDRSKGIAVMVTPGTVVDDSEPLFAEV